MLTKNQFDILFYLFKNKSSTQRTIAQQQKVSLGFVNKIVKELKENGWINHDNVLTDKGMAQLDTYKVDNAIILAAGMSTRFVPVSYEIPKGLTVVKGEVLIERQIRQLHEAGISDIIVVVGHMLEKFFYLRQKYNVKLVVNNDYKVRNTHSSVFAARDYLQNTYICCSDNYYPENLFRSHEYRSFYCSQFLEGESRTERGLITDKSGLIVATEKPCRDAWTMQGHAFFSIDFSRKFKGIIEQYYNRPGTESLYWEGIYAENLEELPMYIEKYGPDDILEFDSVENLRSFDPDYIVHNDLKVIQNICSVLSATPDEIENVAPVKGGMTNKSFSFTLRGSRYIYREPGANTLGYIDREREKFALKIAKGLGIDTSYCHQDELYGWKISHFIETTETFDFKNQTHLEKLCEHLHVLHRSGIKCGSCFDFFSEADKIIERLRLIDPLTVSDIMQLRDAVKIVWEKVIADRWPVQLSHNDIYTDNILISGKDFYLIDWEYAGDTDIGYDLSKLFAVECGDLQDVDKYLSYYYGRTPTAEEKQHIIACASINYYYWYIWAIYQNRFGNDCSEWQMIWHNKMTKYLEESLHLIGKDYV